MKAVAPSRSILLLIGIGFLDLVLTVWLHSQGQIVELNPLMRPLIERSEWLFGIVKGATLVATWAVMASYARVNRKFVRNACVVGSVVYVTVWWGWFLAAA
jgi:hypothetical protein